MELIKNRMPQSLDFTLLKKEGSKGWFGPGERKFSISFLSIKACDGLQKLMFQLDQSVFDSQQMKATGFELVEKHRKQLTLIIPLAVCNYKSHWSNYKFIKKHASAESLLTMLYAAKKQVGHFVIYHYLNEANSEKIRERLAEESKAFHQISQETIDRFNRIVEKNEGHV